MFAGHGSVATPGRGHRLPARGRGAGRAVLGRRLAPAARGLPRRLPVGGAAARYLSYTAHSLFGRDPDAFRVVTRPDGPAVVAGDVVTNHPLADVLELVAREGASVLTTGEVGRAMVDDMAAHGGLVTHLDLAEYTPLVRPPVRRTVGEWDLASTRRRRSAARCSP